MSREIIFDIETIGDIRNLDTMKVTVVSIYEYEHDRYRSFDEHELGELWPIFERAERIIGFNSEHFDVPILNKVYPGDLTKFPHLDMLKVIKDTLGKRFKLNDLARATLNIQKSADGLQAMEWYKQGLIDKIKEYCEQDVKVTKELYEFGRTNKFLCYPTLTGDTQQFPVNFVQAPMVSDTQPAAINFTLPF